MARPFMTLVCRTIPAASKVVAIQRYKTGRPISIPSYQPDQNAATPSVPSNDRRLVVS